MITILAGIGLCTIVFLLWKASSDRQDNNKELLELAQYSEECKEYLKKAENSFPPISYEAKQLAQLKLLKDPMIMKRAQDNLERAQERKLEDEEWYKKHKRDKEFIWRRDHKLLYASFHNRPVLLESEIQQRISNITHNNDLDSIKKRIETWKDYSLIEITRYSHDTATPERKAYRTWLRDYMTAWDTIVSPSEKNQMSIQQIDAENVYLLDSNGQLHIKNRFEMDSLLTSHFYKLLYDGEYLYKMNLGYEYRELLEEGLITSVEETTWNS